MSDIGSAPRSEDLTSMLGMDLYIQRKQFLAHLISSSTFLIKSSIISFCPVLVFPLRLDESSVACETLTFN